MNNFEHIVKLWKQYNEASKALIKAMNSTCNEVGEFAELLCAKYYIN